MPDTFNSAARAGGGPYARPPGTFTRLAANVVALSSVLTGKAMIRAGMRRAPEGWRRTVGVLLRGESTRFAMSAFGLRVPGDHSVASLERRTAEGLLSFLSGEPDAHFALEWLAPVTIRKRVPFVDVVVLRFGAEGVLEAIEPFLAAGGAAAPGREIRGRVHAWIVQAYNRTAGLPELERTLRLARDVDAGLDEKRIAAHRSARDYARRLLEAACLSFESADLSDPAERFRPPSFSARRSLGLGYLSFVVRARPSTSCVDLWVSAHHVGLDGVPLQDVLNRLERAWGTGESVAFPGACGGSPFAGPVACHAPGEREVDHVVTFLDLSPVVALRRAVNEHYRAAIGGEATLGALLAWLVSQEPEFERVRIASTVDIAASGGYERDVDVVSLRAADYMTADRPWGGFVEYAREFNRLIAAARARTGPVRAGMQTAGLIPAWAHAAIVRGKPSALDTTFGTLCITIVRDARVFVSPMTDLGLGHGFFAIGSVNLPSASGGRVASVSIKGDAGRVSHYPAILQRVVDRAAALLEARNSG